MMDMSLCTPWQVPVAHSPTMYIGFISSRSQNSWVTVSSIQLSIPHLWDLRVLSFQSAGLSSLMTLDVLGSRDIQIQKCYHTTLWESPEKIPPLLYFFRPSPKSGSKEGLELEILMGVWSFHEVDSSNTSSIFSRLSWFFLKKYVKRVSMK